MPKVNVYLPVALAAAVRAAGFAVSPICQQALAEAVRSANFARKAIEALRDPAFDIAAHPPLVTRLEGRMVPRLRRAIRLARSNSGARGRVGTGHLLGGVLDEGDNLAVTVLKALEVDLDELHAAASRQAPDEVGPPEAASEGPLWARMTLPARSAVAASLEAATGFGHNYLGCEHWLLGLAAEPAGAAGRALRSLGVGTAHLRRAIATELAGYGPARDNSLGISAAQFNEIVRRLDALEDRLGVGDLTWGAPVGTAIAGSAGAGTAGAGGVTAGVAARVATGPTGPEPAEDGVGGPC
ncbi:MAG: Clp protease N-terminal domain-containing protein [Acidimicrobiales bacterium]